MYLHHACQVETNLKACKCQGALEWHLEVRFHPPHIGEVCRDTSQVLPQCAEVQPAQAHATAMFKPGRGGLLCECRMPRLGVADHTRGWTLSNNNVNGSWHLAVWSFRCLALATWNPCFSCFFFVSVQTSGLCFLCAFSDPWIFSQSFHMKVGAVGWTW